MGDDGARFCPQCDQLSTELVCPDDATPTLPEDLFRVHRDQDPTLGQVFSGRYRIDALLGEGGFGRVYRAQQLSIDRTVALKTLHPRYASSRELVKRFYREARAASRLDSPHVVRVIDFGVDEATGRTYIAMELLHSGDLRAWLTRHGPMAPRRACGVLAQVARALTEAHDKSVIHRDLKPENIHLGRTVDGLDFARVLDFGIAKFINGAVDTDTSLTSTGTAIGTPAYMAPEQIRGEMVDNGADLYALGCVLHELLTGKPPFVGATRMNLLFQQVTATAPSLPETGADGTRIPRALHELHSSLLAKDRDERPLGARPVVDILLAIARDEEVDTLSVLARWRERGQDVDGVTLAARAETAASGAKHARPEAAAELAASSSGSTGRLPALRPPRSVDTKRGAKLPGPTRRGWRTLVTAFATTLVLATGLWTMSSELAPLEASSEMSSDARQPPVPAEPPPQVDPRDPTTSAAWAGTGATMSSSHAASMSTPDFCPAVVATAASTEEQGQQEGVRAPSPVSVTVTSEPEGAIVWQNGAALGPTPYELLLDPEDATPIEVVLRLRGHVSRTVKLAPSDAPTSRFSLERVRRRPKTERRDDFIGEPL